MKRSRLRPKVSDYELEFREMRPLVRERSHGDCEMSVFVARNADLRSPAIAFDFGVLTARCDMRATNTHHRKYRSRGGTNALDNLIDLCGPCHEWIHKHGGFGERANQLRLALSAGESEELT